MIIGIYNKNWSDRMKLLNFFLFFIFLGFFTSLLADDNTIEEEIKEIQHAPKEKRIALMNELKIQMAQMSFYERSHVIDILKKSQQDQRGAAIQTQQVIEARKQEQAQDVQAQTYAHLTQYQSYLQAASKEVHRRLIDPIVNPLPLGH